MLESDPDIEVVGMAKNGKEALEFLSSNSSVDLITLDIQMPVMQGDTTLKHIMIRSPSPVVMISGFRPESLNEIFDFLQLGAIDFMSKPAATEDIAVYEKRLCDLAKRAAMAKVSHFRRLRKGRVELPNITPPIVSPRNKILLILGAEGAYLDWFRLPLSSLSGHGLIIGLQKIADCFLKGFCQRLENQTNTEVLPLLRSEWLNPGKFHFGNAGQRVELKLIDESLSLGVEMFHSDSLPWQEGVNLWLKELAQQAEDKLSIFPLSAAHSFPKDFLSTLLDLGVQFILSPSRSLMCTGLVDSVTPFQQRYPQQIVWGRSDNLMEVWLRNESNE
jgi:two-component system chemotaxis response regulator CheB